MFFQYIKKKDAADYMQTQRRVVAGLFAVLAVVIGSAQGYLFPKVLRLYAGFNASMPLGMEYGPYIAASLAIMSLGLAAYLLLNPVDTKPYLKKIKSAKPSEMINVRQVTDFKTNLLFFAIFMLTLFFFAVFVGKPIYNLTDLLIVEQL